MKGNTDGLEFTLGRIPEIQFGIGRSRSIAGDAAALCEAGKPVALVADGPLVALGLAAPVVEALEQSGAAVCLFDGIDGEPKQAQMEAAADFVRAGDAGLVICLGGGSAMDIGKVAATVARTGRSPADFAMDGDPLPKDSLPKICLPTTAGTGSELSSTNIFTSNAGKKNWVWGPETKPDLVILDPNLTLTLPPHLTAWTGLDAFAHALESCTNARRHAANDVYAHQALGLIAGALETAVREPDNIGARGDMLLGSAYAGIAIDNCSTGMAHNISHAIAALGPMHHGLATGLGLEVVLGWQVEEDDGAFAAAAAACGLARDGTALVDWYSDFITRCGVERKLPETLKPYGAADLALEMKAPDTQYMRQIVTRTVGDDDIDRFAAAMMAMV